MTLKPIISDVTFGVSCCGNVEALQMALASVMNSTVVPARIQVRFEGPLPGFNTFYIAQLSEMARFLGIDFIMTVAKSEGVRAARDWHLNNCLTPYLWMGDDDVTYGFDCLEYLRKGADDVVRQGKCKNALAWGYLCGTKCDLNNRRGWQNFKMDIHGLKDVFDNCSFNWFYDKKECEGRYAEIYTCDTGNCLINMAAVNGASVRFQLFADSVNCGGEDTLFALECHHAGFKSFIVPSAQAFHLEKDRINFREDAARAEMVLRAANIRGYSGKAMEYVKSSFMSWCFHK